MAAASIVRIHAWSLAQDRSLLTLHARVKEGVHADAVVNDVHRRLSERFDVNHSTVQIEIESCVDDGPAAPVASRAFAD